MQTLISANPSLITYRSSFCPKLSNSSLNTAIIHYQKHVNALKFKRKRLGIKLSSSLNNCTESSNSNGSIWRECDCVEVIGIGSRVESVLDFCLSSKSTSVSLRYWKVIREDPLRGKLQQLQVKDGSPNIAGTLLDRESCFKAVILVATAGYGEDHVTVTDILVKIKAAGGLVVAVILKPFSFEGQRRQEEVRVLLDQLQNCVNFRIDIDIDTLLKMDFVTLDEALSTAYRAVYSAIRAISVLASDTHKKQIDLYHDSLKLINVAEVMKVLPIYEEAKVGFGVSCDIKTSIVKAVYDCPFFCVGLKDLTGIVACIISSSTVLSNNDVQSILQTFRQTTDWTDEIIISTFHNPDMQPSLIEVTIIAVGTSEQKTTQNSSILSRLADSIPFVFNFLWRRQPQSDSFMQSKSEKDSNPLNPSNFSDKKDMPDMVHVEGARIHLNEIADGMDNDVTNEAGHSDVNADTSKHSELNVEAYRIADDPVEEEPTVSGAMSRDDQLSIFHLPVGVRHSGDFHGSSDFSSSRRRSGPITEYNVKARASTMPSVSSLNGLTEAGLEAMTDFWSGASTLSKGKHVKASSKQGILSTRAASMLEAERDSKTKWTPIMEVGYRGGIYKGRCQGGLPDGRGRLTFSDGSVYDGMWRYGKRSGLGSFFFTNGDVFHGPWSDDVMHGKGWLYFHTGERWFANFWKGRANGEGRFYSKSGEVIFGYFQDGWRHGHFLGVQVDGTRYVEIWEAGILVSSRKLE